MTSDAPRAAALGALLLLGAAAAPARAAEPYPFEGTWVRANRVCSASAPRVRTYTAHDVTSASGRCGVRKVAAVGSQFEIFEDCRHAEHPGNYTETIRMLGSDLMQIRRQAARLKIARPLRYTRCTAAAPEASRPGAAAPHKPAEEHSPKPPEVKTPEVKAPDTKPADAKP